MYTVSLLSRTWRSVIVILRGLALFMTVDITLWKMPLLYVSNFLFISHNALNGKEKFGLLECWLAWNLDAILEIYTYFFLSFPCKRVGHNLGFPGGSEVKASACNVGDLGSIPRSGRSPGEGNGNPLRYSYLENPMDRGAGWATVHGVTKSWIQLWLSISKQKFSFLCNPICHFFHFIHSLKKNFF